MIPDQRHTPYVILLSPCHPALALLNTQGLLNFSMILLNLPANGTQRVRGVRRSLCQVVRHNPFRAAIAGGVGA